MSTSERIFSELRPEVGTDAWKNLVKFFALRFNHCLEIGQSIRKAQDTADNAAYNRLVWKGAYSAYLDLVELKAQSLADKLSKKYPNSAPQ